MGEERDPRFYIDLKQVNNDLYKYITECREKTLYHDFTPTFDDYIKQIDGLLKQYPPNIFGSLTSTASTTPLFSFTNPKPQENDQDDQDEQPPEPKVDRFEEKDYKYSVRAKLYEKEKSSGEIRLNLLGIGYFYVKNLGPEKLHVIFRKEPDLWTVLLNEVVTTNIPIGKLPQKAIHLVFPSETGDPRSYILKAKDEKDAEDIYNILNSLKE